MLFAIDLFSLKLFFRFTKDRIAGFEGVAKLEHCTTEGFERRLALNGMIDYDGDPRGKFDKEKGPVNVIRKSTLARNSFDNDSDSEGDSDTD